MGSQETKPQRNLTSGRELDHYINGQFARSNGKARLVIKSPATGEHLGSAPDATVEDVNAAVVSAASAFESGIWSRIEALDRNSVLNSIADAFAKRVDYFAMLDSAVTGRPIREMRAQMGRLPEWFRYFGGIACGLEGSTVPFKGEYHSYTRHAPIGVVGMLTPWNHPLLIMVKKLAAALAAGNSVVVKPSELAPLSALLFAELAHDAGLPAGVMNVVAGQGNMAGRALCNSRKIARIDFTGGNEAGRQVASAAANRFVQVKLELGGKAPVVIFDDTPRPEAVAGAAFASFVASGQTCVSGARILVQDSIHDQFVEAFRKKAMAIRLGDPSDPSTDLGPLISQRQMELVLSYIKIGLEEGAELVCGGHRAKLGPPLEAGFYLEPTIFSNVNPAMRIAQEEIFGPVICVIRFRDEADAIRLANETRFGLGASVWTRDIGRAHRVASQINAGIVWVNDHHKNNPSSIWGGFGDSGYGKDNGWDALKDYTKKQSVIVRLTDEFSDWFGDSTSKRYG